MSVRKNYKYIVVEDEDLIRSNIIKKMKALDFPLEFAGDTYNGKDALKLIENVCPDIVFTDIKMPIMDGLELAEEIYFTHPKIKLIVITGHNDFELAQKAIRFGVTDYILKPVQKEEIVNVLQRVIERIENTENKLLEFGLKKNYSKKDTINLVEKFIQDNYKNEITLSSVAEKVGFTSDYLSKQYKKYKNESPIKYISKLRVEEAKRLLIEMPEVEVKTIGEMVGYFDQYYFSRVFKHQAGVYPTEFRRDNML